MDTEQTVNPARACLACGYVLDGLPTARCPECGRGFDPADARTFVTLKPVQTRTWGRYLGNVGVIAAVLLLYSLGYYWAEDGVVYDPISPSIERAVRFGLPVPWLTWSTATNPALTMSSPWGFKPGIQVAGLRLALALAGAVTLAVAADAVVWGVRRRFPRWRPPACRRVLLLSAALGVAAGCAMGKKPDWLTVALGLGVLPAGLLIFTWRPRSYVLIPLAAATATAGFVWATWVSDLLKAEHLVNEASLREGLVAPLVFSVAYSLPLLFITWLRRVFARSKVGPEAVTPG
jgi:hypothetical protein